MPSTPPMRGSCLAHSRLPWMRCACRMGEEERQASARQRTLRRKLEWVSMAPGARQAKSKARVSQYEQLLAENESADQRHGAAEITIPAGPRLGDLVIEAQGVRKAYG